MSNQISTRIWENESSASPPNSVPSRPAQLPSIATLTNNLPSGTDNPASPAFSNNRSSDQWATPPQSTRKLDLPSDKSAADIFRPGSSAYSSGPNGYYHSSSISSPHRASNSSQFGATSHPSGFSDNSQASPGFAPPQHSLGLPTINQQYQDPSQYRSSHEFPTQDSRRSSLGSQVNGFNNLHINSVASPPYQGANQSQSSIAASLQRERGIPHANGVRHSGTSSIQQPMSPLAPYPGESRQAYSSRTAPIISANPMKEVYNAEKPTAGQPYAFPDPDFSNRSSGSGDANGSTMMSRRNSDHTSITSSIVTSDSRLPVGQHRLDEGTSKYILKFMNRLLTPVFQICRAHTITPSSTSKSASWPANPILQRQPRLTVVPQPFATATRWPSESGERK